MLNPYQPEHPRKVIYLHGDEPSTEDLYWAGYLDGVNCQSQIDKLACCGVVVLVFFAGVFVGLMWQGV